MAGDWIKMRAGLLTHPKVLGMVKYLAQQNEFFRFICDYSVVTNPDHNAVTDFVTNNALRYVTVSGLLSLWSAARQHSDAGRLVGLTLRDLDDMAGIPCFGKAMAEVGWAEEDSELQGVVLVNFTEWNEQPAKEKAKTNAERQRAWRERQKMGSDVPVTKVTNRNGRGEERREENNTPLPPHGPDACVKDFAPEVQAMAKEVFHARWFALKGCLPNLERQDARQEYREIADKIATHVDGYEKLKAYFAQPPIDHGKTVKLWVIFNHLGFDPELRHKPRSPPTQRLPKADELAAKINAENAEQMTPEAREARKRAIEAGRAKLRTT